MTLARELSIAAGLGEPFCKFCFAQTREFRATRRRLARKLFEDSGHVYALIDGARHDGVESWLRDLDTPHLALFAEDNDPDILEVTPWLVALPDQAAFDDIFSRVWGHHAGLFLKADAPIDPLCQHLRSLIYAELPDGDICIFRFWDPRVLARLVDVATPDQTDQLSGGIVHAVYLEGPKGVTIRYPLRIEAPGGPC